MGGDNLYQYAPNTTQFVDILGLFWDEVGDGVKNCTGGLASWMTFGLVSWVNENSFLFQAADLLAPNPAGKVFKAGKYAYKGANALVKTSKKADKIGELYHLVAKKDGFYPVMKWGQKDNVGGVLLKKGDVWKIGETSQLKNGVQQRYSTKWLDKNKLEYKMNSPGVKSQNKVNEVKQLKEYKACRGNLPPGNKCMH